MEIQGNTLGSQLWASGGLPGATRKISSIHTPVTLPGLELKTRFAGKICIVATDQQVINSLATTGAIKLSGGSQPTFLVNTAVMRSVFRPEQLALNPVPLPAGAPTTRSISGNITLPGALATDPPVTIPIMIELGAPGRFPPGASVPGTPATLVDITANGKILIAVGGDGHPASLGASAGKGGDAFVLVANENLIVALGGNGGTTATPLAPNGGTGGDATAIGFGAGNDLYAEGGTGMNAEEGLPGTPAVAGIPPTPGGTGGTGGAGGNGGSGLIVGGERSYGKVIGGNSGNGGPGGAPGPAAGPVRVPVRVPFNGIIGTIPIPGTAAPAGTRGPGGPGGKGGNITYYLGANSKFDPTSSPGVVLSTGGTPGIPPGAGGTAGTTTKL